MAQIFPTSNSEINTNIFLKRYILESKYFFYQRVFSKRKNRLKITTRSTTYSYDKVRNDFFLNLRYGLKTFFTINTTIVKELTNQFSKFPLISTSLYKNKFKDLSIYNKHIIYRSNQDFRFRNITLQLKPFKKEFYLKNTQLLTKPLNKILFFNLIFKIKNFSFKFPIFIFDKSWKKNLLQIYYLGFKFLLKNNPKTNKRLFLKTLKRKKFFRKVKKNTNLKKLFWIKTRKSKFLFLKRSKNTKNKKLRKKKKSKKRKKIFSFFRFRIGYIFKKQRKVRKYKKKHKKNPFMKLRKNIKKKFFRKRKKSFLLKKKYRIIRIQNVVKIIKKSRLKRKFLIKKL